MIQDLFLPHEADWILQQPISQIGSSDRLIWNLIVSEQYSVKSAYSLIIQHKEWATNKADNGSSNDRERQMWRRTCDLKIKRKISHFIWRCLNGILPTTDQLCKKGMQIDGTCKTCGKGQESLKHFFFACRKAKLVWNISPLRWDSFQQFKQSFSIWWGNLCGLGNQNHNSCMLEFTACILCQIRKCKNNWFLNNLMRSESEIIENAQSEWLEYLALQEENQSKNVVPQRVRAEEPINEELGMRLEA